ncbi:MAG: pseudouridine synthase [Sphingobacteriaceae bacterium]
MSLKIDTFTVLMESNPNRYFIVYKPYKMVSQFVSPDNVNLLGQLDFDFPEGTHAIGRLDNNSEGLLILTTNKKVTKLLFQSDIAHKRTYLVQVQWLVTPETLEKLRTGVTILMKNSGGGSYHTQPCEVDIIEKPANLPKRHHEFRESLPHTWLRMTLTEGKFHQIRKMVAGERHQCKRLIRVSIEDLHLGDLQPGGVREIGEEEFFRALKIDNWQ